MKYESIQEKYIFLRGIRGPVLCLAQGRLRLYHSIVKVSGAQLSFQSEERQQEVYDRYQAIASTLDFPLQVITTLRPLDIRAHTRYTLPSDDGEEAWRKLASSHVEHIEQLAFHMLTRQAFLVIPAEERTLHPFRRREQETVSLLQAAQQLRSRCDVLIEQLNATGAACTLLHDEQLAQFYARFYLPDREIGFAVGIPHQTAFPNVPQRHAPLGEEEQKPEPNERKSSKKKRQKQHRGYLRLEDVVAPGAIEEMRDHVRIDDHWIRVLRIDGLPRTVTPGWLLPFLERSEDPFDLVWQLQPLPRHRAVAYLRRQQAHALASQAASLEEGHLLEADAALAQTDLGPLTQAVSSGEQSLIESSLHLLIHAETQEALDERTLRINQRVTSAFAQRARTCPFEQATMLRASSPGKLLPREPLLLPSAIVATMFPFPSALPFKPGELALLEGVTRTGEAIVVDWWRDFPNANRVLLGQTGWGKSYKSKLDVLHIYAVYKNLAQRHHQKDDGFQIILIDPEREMHNVDASLVDALSGQHIRFSAGSPHRLNPFDLPHATRDDEQEEDLLANHIQKVQSLFDIMLAENERLKPQEKAMLEHATRKAYEQAGITQDRRTHRCPAPLLRDMYAMLQTISGISETLLWRLHRYVEGPLSPLFSGPTNVALDSTLVQYDTRLLDKDLRPIALWLVTNQIWNASFAAPIPRFLVIDELASLARHPAGQEFLEDAFARARKRNISVTGITQHASSLSETILGNCAVKILFYHEEASTQQLADLFQLSQQETRTISSLPRGHAFFLLPGQRHVVRFFASERENALITTNRREISDLRKEEKCANSIL